MSGHFPFCQDSACLARILPCVWLILANPAFQSSTDSEKELFLRSPFSGGGVRKLQKGDPRQRVQNGGRRGGPARENKGSCRRRPRPHPLTLLGKPCFGTNLASPARQTHVKKLNWRELEPIADSLECDSQSSGDGNCDHYCGLAATITTTVTTSTAAAQRHWPI